MLRAFVPVERLDHVRRRFVARRPRATVHDPPTRPAPQAAKNWFSSQTSSRGMADFATAKPQLTSQEISKREPEKGLDLRAIHTPSRALVKTRPREPVPATVSEGGISTLHRRRCRGDRRRPIGAGCTHPWTPRCPKGSGQQRKSAIN